jgi:hypothetical protein
VNPQPGNTVDPNHSEDLQPGSRSRPLRRFTTRQQPVDPTIQKIYKKQEVDPKHSEDLRPCSGSKPFRRFTNRQ